MSVTGVVQSERKDNPTLGSIFYVFSILNSTVQLVFGKLLFDNQPKFKPEMALLMRSAWSLVLLILLINFNFKKIMVDSVKKNDYPYLTFRTLSSTLTQVINTFASKYIPLTIIGVTNNLSPLCTVVLAYIFLGERLKMLEIVFLGLLAAGIFTIVLGASKTSNPKEKTITQAPWLYVALFINPLLVASGTIISRKIKHIHEYVAAVYINISTLLFNMAIMLSYKEKLLPVLANFSSLDWVCSVMQGICFVNI